jgi:hypothetical protein
MGRRSQDGEFPLLKVAGLKACDIRGDGTYTRPPTPLHSHNFKLLLVIATNSLCYFIGNCLFNALSDQIYGHQNNNREIRSIVIEYMRNNRDQFIHFINVDVNRRNPKRKNTAASASWSFTAATEEEQNEAYEAHLGSMSRGGTYGDNVEIIAFAKEYNTDVKIYQDNYSYYVRAVPDDGAEVRPIARIAYHVSSP